MCQFNIILTEKDTDTVILKQVLIANGFSYNEIDNNYIKSQTNDLQKIVCSTNGHCDCGSILGIDIQSSSNSFDIEKERKKLKKKKWTDSKIDRFIADKLKSQTKNEQNEGLGNAAEETRWMTMIKQLAANKIKFGILYHQFSGPLEDEILEIGKVDKFEIDKLTCLLYTSPSPRDRG